MTIFYSLLGRKRRGEMLNIEDKERPHEGTEVVARIFKGLSYYLKLPEIKSGTSVNCSFIECICVGRRKKNIKVSIQFGTYL
jgi:hypothetical protein